MKKIKYIIAASIAAFALSTSAFAVGDIIDGVENGAEDIIDGAGDAADDIIGDGAGDGAGDAAGDGAGDPIGDGAGDIAGDNADDTVGDATTDNAEDITTAEITTEDITTMPEVTTGAAGAVGSGNDSNANTGFVLTFSALGAAAAGLTVIASRKRK